MCDTRYIIFEVLIEYEIEGERKYNATSLSDFMNGKSVEECNSKWTICGYHIVDMSKKIIN